jgi:hypothetical protein
MLPESLRGKLRDYLQRLPEWHVLNIYLSLYYAINYFNDARYLIARVSGNDARNILKKLYTEFKDDFERLIGESIGDASENEIIEKVFRKSLTITENRPLALDLLEIAEETLGSILRGGVDRIGNKVGLIREEDKVVAAALSVYYKTTGERCIYNPADALVGLVKVLKGKSGSEVHINVAPDGLV